jgi:hypothetical protein
MGRLQYCCLIWAWHHCLVLISEPIPKQEIETQSFIDLTKDWTTIHILHRCVGCSISSTFKLFRIYNQSCYRQNARLVWENHCQIFCSQLYRNVIKFAIALSYKNWWNLFRIVPNYTSNKIHYCHHKWWMEGVFQVEL